MASGTPRDHVYRRLSHYCSPNAQVDGDIELGEGCVILDFARLSAAAHCKLVLGPYCVVEEYAELHVTAPPSPASSSTTPFVVHIGGFNRFSPHARFDGVAPLLQALGRGNILQPYAALIVAPTGASGSVPSTSGHIHKEGHPTAMGNYNVVSAYTTVYAGSGVGEPQRSQKMEEDTLAVPNVTYDSGSSQGKVVEQSPQASKETMEVPLKDSASSPCLTHHTIFLRRWGGQKSNGATAGETEAVPRYGTRSLAEVPTIVSAMAAAAAEQQQHEQEKSSTSPSAPPLSVPSATLSQGENDPSFDYFLKYTSTVHPSLRHNDEAQIEVGQRCICQLYLSHYSVCGEVFQQESHVR